MVKCSHGGQPGGLLSPSARGIAFSLHRRGEHHVVYDVSLTDRHSNHSLAATSTTVYHRY